MHYWKCASGCRCNQWNRHGNKDNFILSNFIFPLWVSKQNRAMYQQNPLEHIILNRRGTLGILSDDRKIKASVGFSTEKATSWIPRITAIRPREMTHMCSNLGAFRCFLIRLCSWLILESRCNICFLSNLLFYKSNSWNRTEFEIEIYIYSMIIIMVAVVVMAFAMCKWWAKQYAANKLSIFASYFHRTPGLGVGCGWLWMSRKMANGMRSDWMLFVCVHIWSWI